MISTNNTPTDLHTQVNQLLNLLNSSQVVYGQLELYCDNPRLENCFRNIAARRKNLSDELIGIMKRSHLKIDKRAGATTKYAYPDRMDEIDLIHHFITMDSLLQKKCRDLLINPECPPLLKKILKDHYTTIDADNKELHSYISSEN